MKYTNNLSIKQNNINNINNNIDLFFKKIKNEN